MLVTTFAVAVFVTVTVVVLFFQMWNAAFGRVTLNTFALVIGIETGISVTEIETATGKIGIA